jgi:23S rRNA (pseudouridine1915-N3)-methyltransferase
VKIRLLAVTRTDEPYIREGMEYFVSRIKRYNEFEIVHVKASTSADPAVNRRLETKALLEKIAKNETLVALDEHGKQFTSEGFVQFIDARKQQSVKTLTFVIGGSYGFDKELLEQAAFKIALSQMTLPHQLARLMFAEQLYRAFTILKGEKYHHA